jgi:molybdopterin converting factor small subunit
MFAVARQIAGAEQVSVELTDEATVQELRAALGQQVPALAPLLKSVAFAIDSRYAVDATRIPADAEVACIPPVSGG